MSEKFTKICLPIMALSFHAISHLINKKLTLIFTEPYLIQPLAILEHEHCNVPVFYV